MKIRTLFLIIILFAICVFAAINWSAFTAPTALFLVFRTVHMPLGLVMLGITACLTALFIVFAVSIQTSALLVARRHERDLQAMRELAERAETSRFTRLYEFFEKEMQKLTDVDKESNTEILARLNQLENELKLAIDQSANSLAAYIGEIDDKLQKEGH